MWVRILSSAAALALLFGVLFWLPEWVIPAVMMVLCAIMVREFLGATGFIKNRAILICAVVFSMLIPPWVYQGASYAPANVTLFLYTVLLFALALGSQRQVTLEQIGGAFFASLFIPLALTSVLRVRMMPEGYYLVMMPLIAAFISDTCAYFTGIAVGRTKMAPGISPKKTWEGSVGGLLGCVGGMLLFGWIMNRAFGYNVNWAILAFAGVLGSVAAQFGDLCFSYVKRQFGIKDYGHLMPGHGGALDRCDSLLFAAPTIEFLLTIVGGMVLWH